MDKMRSVCGQHCAAFQAFCIIHQMPSDPLNIWLLISSWLHKKKTPSLSPMHYSRPGKIQCDDFHFRYREYYLFTDLKLTLIDNFNEALTQRQKQKYRRVSFILYHSVKVTNDTEFR